MLAATACAALLVSVLSLGYVGIDARPAAAANITYTAEILSGFEATEGLSIARGVNTSGQVVGQSPKRFPGVTPPLQSRAFFWDGGSIEDLGTLGGLSGAARGINDEGQIVGFSRPLDTTNQQAFVTKRATDGTTKLEALGALQDFPSSEAFAINEPEQIGESGEIVGRSFLPTSGVIRSGRAFLYRKNENGVMVMDNLGVLSSAEDSYSEAWAINDSGQVVGESGTDENHGKAFLYSGGIMKPLGTLDGQLYSEAFGIDNSGQIVGWSYNSRTPVQGQAFIYRDGEMEKLGTLPNDSYSMARAIDEHGRVVGQSLDASGRNRAFLWEDGVMTDLNTLIPADPSLRLLDAYAISESGKIVGSAIKDGVVRPFVLTPDITGPKIECGTADGLWHEEDVSISCTASDDGVGLADPADDSFTLTTNVSEGTETADAPTGSREVCDAASNCATAGPVGGNMVDKKAPDTTASSGSYNEGDWTNQSVTVTLEASDGGSGVQRTEYNLDSAGYLTYEAGGILVSNEGQHNILYKSTDNVDNAEFPAKDFSINIDNTSPEITGSRSPASNANGWNNTDVTVHFACADAMSGLASDCPADVVMGEGEDQSVTRDISDEAGNSASATVGDINVDETAPTVDVTGVSDGATYILGSVPAADCSTTDGLSGVDQQATLNVTGGPLGSITATCDGALDRAGNAGSAGVTYDVIYDFDGFFSPVDDLPVLNRVKAGSAIPVKFSLGGDQGLDIFAEADGSSFPRSEPIPCGSTDPVDRVEQTVTTNSSGLTYDAETGLYTYVWRTSRGWTGCRQLVVRLDDGKEYTANFEFSR